MAGVDTTNDESGIEVIEPLDSLTKTVASQAATLAAILADQRMDGWEILAIENGGGALPQSQHIRFRVRYVILSRVVSGPTILLIGTRSFRWETTSWPIVFPFPLVIERGVDISSSVGDGFTYLIGSVE